MYNIIYTSSTIASFRTKGQLPPFSYNDYYNRTASCSSCVCCGFCSHGVPINPRYSLYGLSQSTLLHLSAYRRFIISSRDPYCRLFVSDTDRGCRVENDACFVKASVGVSGNRRGKERGRKEGEFCCSGGMGEAVLGLLSELVDEKFLGNRQRNSRFNLGNGRSGRRERCLAKCCAEEKNTEFESVTNISREERSRNGRKLGRGEVSSCHDGSRLRKEGSSCSSYYSVMSFDDIDESDIEVENGDRYSGPSSIRKNEEIKSGDIHKGNTRKKFEKYEDCATEFGEISQRKNGEKSYKEESFVENESKKESLQKSFITVGSRENAAKSSHSLRQLHAKDKNSASSSNFEDTGEKRGHSGRLYESRKDFRQSSEAEEIRDIDVRKLSSSQTRISGMEENMTSSGTLVQEARKEYNQVVDRGNRESRSSLNSQVETKTSIHDIDVERTSHSQSTSDKMLNSRVGISSQRLPSVNDSREQSAVTKQRLVEGTQKLEQSQDLIDISVNHTINTNLVAERKETSDKRMISRTEKSTSSVDLTKGVRGHQASEQVIRSVESSNSTRPTELSSFRESSKKRDSSSHKRHSSVLRQTRQDQVASHLQEATNSEVTVMAVGPVPSQSVARTSRETIGSQKPTSSRQHVSLETVVNESIILHSEEDRLDYPHELNERMRRDENYGDHLEATLYNDSLGSANRLEECSKKFVEEFTEKVQQEINSSELVGERTSSQETLVRRNVAHQHSSEQASDIQSQVDFSGQSYNVTGVRGPSDEMWHVSGSVPLESSKEHEDNSPAPGNAILKRSSRSLWNFIADIVRMRWHARSDTNGLIVKSKEKNSSSESITSDAWFSSLEPDENIDENVKKGRRRKKGENKPDVQSHPAETSSQSQGKVTSSTYSQIESEISSPLVTFESGSPSEASACIASQKEYSGDKQEVVRSEGIISTIITTDSSVSLHSKRLIRSPPVKDEVSESGKAKVPSARLTEVVEQPIIDNLLSASTAELNDGELKRRKLQRNKQVLQERFEEWEEAYRHEAEQKQIDEIFMREALLEARKAANTWEVPVGAVMVQDGKIIARGCNLVEELRDSTAHAEMICIREASNTLRSWRLADTTLYVTLEPCAMCAGAILQARIDTVVWGAPNKLLGADGSWVRLFPGDPESASDATNQPPGPVHPFHPKMSIRRGVLATECAEVMQQFFQLRRKKKSPSPPPPSCLPVSPHPSKFFSKIHDIFSVMFCL
ncbi:hypothetical protein Scep_012563 [Stephania cephalantha]|uniref:tRNA(adenine(34)) deaminase n=1 Tax=Stephania cephalantha TaxID=152367 RepID=A0AAP0JHC6_9MAGN